MLLREPSARQSYNSLTGVKVLFSEPATLHVPLPLPDGSRHLGREAAYIRDFGQRYPGWLSGLLLRAWCAWRLWRERGAFDGAVTGRCGELYAVTQALWPFGRKPHLLLDVEWLHRHTRWWRRLLSVWDHRLIARGAWKVQVFCEAEVDAYASYYGLDRNKLVWIPYCTDLDETSLDVADGDYLFTGGSQNRDYETLGRAVRGLPVTVKVAAPPGRIDPRCRTPNMELLGTVPKGEFWSTLARARAVVLSLDPDVMRCPGVITYVTALRLGKCVVVNEPRGAGSYIVHGKTGLIVPARDPTALRGALERVLTDDALRHELAENARVHAAANFSGARYRAEVAALLRQWPCPGRGEAGAVEDP
jgi:glycosyltransferase involved in cell wall biosynthesis